MSTGREGARTSAPGSYTFGDSTLAARRLALLADVFAPATTRFLGRLAGERTRLAVDLGCGPGFTTTLARDVLAAERVIGIDASAAFAAQAGRRLGPRGDALQADVLDLPPAVRDADVIFARFLISHLTDPGAAIAHWLDRLAPTGALGLLEVESISTREPVLRGYLDLQRRMLHANGHSLEVGAGLTAAACEAGGQVVRSELAAVTPAASAAARMFAMNLATWGARAHVTGLADQGELAELRAGLDELAAGPGPGPPIRWELRELTLVRR